MAGPVVCFGELLLRLTSEKRLLSQADTFALWVGGAEANVAAALASLDHAVRFVSAVSNNDFGDRSVAALRAAGVDTTGILRTPGRMGLYFMEAGSGLRPSSIMYDRADSAFVRVAPEAIDFLTVLKGASLFHCGGITPALGPNGVALARVANAAARKAAVPICFDGNYRSTLWDAWECEPRTALHDLVSDATILMGNHRDISLLLGRSFPGEGPDRRREAVEAAFAEFPNLRLIASTARHLVTSSHHRLSARVDARDSWHQTEDMEVTGVLDRIGAGDAFAAGVLDAWLDAGDVRAMAETGLALSALKHTLRGDMTLIPRKMLDQFQAGTRDVRR